MIKLYNRDRLNLWLEHTVGDFYTLRSDEQSKWALEYLRVGLSEDNNRYTFVDPPGGPFLDLGYELKDNSGKKYIITEISCKPFLFTLKETI